MAKKKRRKVPEGVDPNVRRRERLEARRQAKAEAIARQRRAEQRARLIRLFVYAALAAVAVWFFFFRGADLPEEIRGNEVASFSDLGQQQHRPPPISYDEPPPVAGPHANAPVPCGTYASPVPNENLVHSLEHGGVYALYSPDLPIEQIRRLEGLAEKEGWDDNFLVAPYEGLPENTLVSVGAWGFRMDLEELDPAAIVEFKNTFEAQGTQEADAGCENSSDATFEPQEEAVPDPAITPEPTPEPTPSASKDKKN